MRRSRAVDGRRQRPGRLVGAGARDAVRRRRAVGPAGPLDRWALRRFRLASRHLRGRPPEPRHDEVVSAAVRLHEATGKLERPRFLTQGPTAPWADVDVFIAADRAAWEERPLQSVPSAARAASPSADGQRSIELINQLAGLRTATKSPNQLVRRRPLRHRAVRRCRRPRDHRHHAVLAARVVGGGSGRRRRVVVGRGRRRADRALERRCRNGRRCCCAR